jgi:DNA helicase-2/ATP-dependent DNA helicase PcrA
MTVGAIASALFERSRYDEWLKSRYDDKGEYEDRSRNVHELLNSIAEYARRERGATIEDYLQSISLYTSGDDDKTENAVRLMSLHASKGLEFDVVYLIGVEHKILPHEKALQDRPERGLDEERRLCYVGFTRARKILRVTWCAKRQDAYAKGKTARFKPTIPSQFLVESGLLARDDYQKAMADAGFVPAAAPKAKRRVPAKTR